MQQPTTTAGSMLRRSHTHDYKSPCIYLLTVTVEGRCPLLGKVSGDIHTAHIELSPLGEAVRYELHVLCKHYPQLRLLQYQIMPDHVHVVIQVTQQLDKPIGNLFSSWKIACGRAYGRLSGASALPHDKRADTAVGLSSVVPLSGETALAPHERTPFRRLFSEGYNDRILQGKDQLQRMIDYVRDNPRRLLIKSQQSPYFTIRRNIEVAGHTMDAVGNLALLQSPLMAVHCRRHWSPTDLKAYTNLCTKASQQGIVLIGAFISEAEKTIAMHACVNHRPLIHLMENGFPALYKPIGLAFYTCAEGLLLQLAPWKHHTAHTAITREQCKALNIIAESIALATQ